MSGQAPRARPYKEDFQAVDIESIAKPVTKWAVTVREPGLVPRAGDSPEQVGTTLVENLRYASGELKRASVKLLVEPVNDKDIPGFWLTRADQAISVMDEVGSDNLFLQYDIYHQSRMDGELTATFRRFKDRIAHVQVADNPGRNEPGTGEINYPFLFDMLDREGYRGWIGCEYKPAAKTSDGLGWAAAYLGRK